MRVGGPRRRRGASRAGPGSGSASKSTAVLFVRYCCAQTRTPRTILATRDEPVMGSALVSARQNGDRDRARRRSYCDWTFGPLGRVDPTISSSPLTNPDVNLKPRKFYDIRGARTQPPANTRALWLALRDWTSRQAGIKAASAAHRLRRRAHEVYTSVRSSAPHIKKARARTSETRRPCGGIYQKASRPPGVKSS